MSVYENTNTPFVRMPFRVELFFFFTFGDYVFAKELFVLKGSLV